MFLPKIAITQILNEIFQIRYDSNFLSPDVNSTFLQNSLQALTYIISTKLYQDAVFDQIDYDTVRTLTKSVMVTIGIVVSKVDWTNYTTSELTQLTTQIFQIYSDYSLFLNRKFIDQNHDGMQVYSPNVRLGAKTFRLGIDN